MNVYPVFSSNPVLSILACLKSIKMYLYWQKKMNHQVRSTVNWGSNMGLMREIKIIRGHESKGIHQWDVTNKLRIITQL